MTKANDFSISDTDLARARQKGAAQTHAVHAVAANYLPNRRSFEIALNTGWCIQVPQNFSKTLSHAQAAACQNIVITDSGLSLHWPDLDEDWFIPAVLAAISSQDMAA